MSRYYVDDGSTSRRVACSHPDFPDRRDPTRQRASMSRSVIYLPVSLCGTREEPRRLIRDVSAIGNGFIRGRANQAKSANGRGAVWVTSICRSLPHSAHLIEEIIRISNVFEDGRGLLICGLGVRFPPGSPKFVNKSDDLRSAFGFNHDSSHTNLHSTDYEPAKTASILAAASRWSAGRTWLYVFSVSEPDCARASP